MDDDWTEALRRAGDALRPAPDAMAQIGQEVRRRRRRRRVATVVAGGVTTIAVATGFAVLPRGGDPSVAEDPLPGVGDGLFSCPDTVPVPAQLGPDGDARAAWEEARQAILATEFADFSVHTAQVTSIGVVVLVTGDVGEARRVLTTEYDAAAAHPWQPGVADVGLDEDGQVDQAVGWVLQPVMREARRRTRGIDGAGAIGYLRSSGAVLVQWKDPVPAEVRALEQLDPVGGGRIVVEGVPYSERELLRAQEKVVVAARADRTVGWTATQTCGDGSGLIVGISPATLRDRRAELEQELTRVAGVPVMVIAQDAPMPAGPGVG